ncbi:MAG TPA: PIN domain-containing protein [Ktedonobacterales bacterium]|jgi:uncharacterized protein YacL
MSGRLIARIVGFITVVAVVAAIARDNAQAIQRQFTPLENQAVYVWAAVGVALLCGVIAFIITPIAIILPYSWVRDQIRRANVSDVIAAVVGLIVGLVIAALLTLPLSQLRFLGLDQWLPATAALVCGFLGVTVAVLLRQDFVHLATASLAARAARAATRREEREARLDREDREDREAREDHDDREDHEDRSGQSGRFRDRRAKDKDKEKDKGQRQPDRVLVDTSAIIDGRIADISQTGFVSGTLVVPRFVLEELQHIADSSDSLRRNRGRRGLEILNRLQKETNVPVEISDADAEGTHEVDAKLVKLARQWHCPIITNDFNLNRVAALQGVKVLNINELAHAVKPILLPGEELAVKIIQDGKELGQGVGYLDDGTMIVVEGGKQYIGANVDVMVTRVLQTVAGRMIFGQPKVSAPAASGGNGTNGAATSNGGSSERASAGAPARVPHR